MEVEAALEKECVTPTKDGSFSVGPDGDNSAVQRSPKTGKVADEAELPEGTSVEGPVEEKTSVKGLHRFYLHSVTWSSGAGVLL